MDGKSGHTARREIGGLEPLSLATTFEEIVKRARSLAQAHLKVDGIAYVLRDGDMCHYVEEDAIGPLFKGKRYPAFSCVSGQCMINAQTISCPDIYADPRIPHELYRSTFIRTLVMIPLGLPTPAAAMGFYWARRWRPDGRTIALLEDIAAAAATPTLAALGTMPYFKDRLI